MSKRKYARAIPALVLMLGLSLAGGAASADESVVPAEGAAVVESIVPIVIDTPAAPEPSVPEPAPAPVVEEEPATSVPEPAAPQAPEPAAPAKEAVVEQPAEQPAASESAKTPVVEEAPVVPKNTVSTDPVNPPEPASAPVVEEVPAAAVPAESGTELIKYRTFFHYRHRRR